MVNREWKNWLLLVIASKLTTGLLQSLTLTSNVKKIRGPRIAHWMENVHLGDDVLLGSFRIMNVQMYGPF